MLFNSVDFLIFFPIVTLFYYVIPRRFRCLWLLIASYYFYMGWNPRYALLLLFSTVVTYISGILLDIVANISKTDRKRVLSRIIVFVCVAANMGILFFYKYFDFATYLYTGIMERIGITVEIRSFDILLPVGISFYTFQALSYTIDLYRGDISAEKDFFRYALYVSFFPQLVAGPIERSKRLLKQLAIYNPFNFDRAREGFLLMLWGYFLKIVLADRIAIVVDTVYDNYEKYSGWYCIVATILFAFQIYCDFAGYSSIAIGAARILGIDLMENFNAPYCAGSVADFWRRWHISLTSWFRDYLYIPLGGNRQGKIRKYFNILIVFIASGLWHGAGMHFVIWGALNGLYQIIGELLHPLLKKIESIMRLNDNSLGFKIYKTVSTFIFVDLAWVYFRADRVHIGNEIMRSILHADNPWIFFDGSLYKIGLNEKSFRLMIVCIFVLIVVDIANNRGYIIRKEIIKQDYIFRWIVIVAAIFFILTCGLWGPGFSPNNFIYFQF